jgi:hypothetical protein
MQACFLDREFQEALQRDVKTTYDEFLALDLDVTSPIYRRPGGVPGNYGYAPLRRQRVPLEYR